VYNHLILHVNVNTVHFSYWYHSYWYKKKLNRTKWHIQFHTLQGLKWCTIYRGMARFLCPRQAIAMAAPNRNYKLGRGKNHYLLIFLLHIWLNNLKYVKCRNIFFYLLCILTLLGFYCLGRCTTCLPPPSLPPATDPNDTTVICSYMLERNTDTNKHMTQTTDNRTYSMVLTLNYPLLSIKFIFTDLY